MCMHSPLICAISLVIIAALWCQRLDQSAWITSQEFITVLQVCFLQTTRKHYFDSLLMLNEWRVSIGFPWFSWLNNEESFRFTWFCWMMTEASDCWWSLVIDRLREQCVVILLAWCSTQNHLMFHADPPDVPRRSAWTLHHEAAVVNLVIITCCASSNIVVKYLQLRYV